MYILYDVERICSKCLQSPLGVQWTAEGWCYFSSICVTCITGETYPDSTEMSHYMASDYISPNHLNQILCQIPQFCLHYVHYQTMFTAFGNVYSSAITQPFIFRVGRRGPWVLFASDLSCMISLADSTENKLLYLKKSKNQHLMLLEPVVSY